jgi:hypothetical protein
MKESDLSRLIQIELSADGVRLWRFAVGNYELVDGRRLTVGIPGMSDLLGFTPVTITQGMVGQTLAVFTAVEVKRPGAYTEKKRLAAQDMFCATVRRYGGLAGIANSVEEARVIVGQLDWPGTEG